MIGFVYFTIHTTALNLTYVLVFFLSHYEVIISLKDDVFTLGPFKESFMSLLNIDKFCVNLKMRKVFQRKIGSKLRILITVHICISCLFDFYKLFSTILCAR